MSNQAIEVFMPISIMMGIAILLYGAALLVANLISPKKPSEFKDMPYECGEEPSGDAWSMFNVRFYVVGLVFIIFDVESVLMFPVAVIFKKMASLGLGSYVLVIFLSFISILTAGIAYCWKKGDLDWVRTFTRNNKLESK